MRSIVVLLIFLASTDWLYSQEIQRVNSGTEEKTSPFAVTILSRPIQNLIPEENSPSALANDATKTDDAEVSEAPADENRLPLGQTRADGELVLGSSWIGSKQTTPFSGSAARSTTFPWAS